MGHKARNVFLWLVLAAVVVVVAYLHHNGPARRKDRPPTPSTTDAAQRDPAKNDAISGGPKHREAVAVCGTVRKLGTNDPLAEQVVTAVAETKADAKQTVSDEAGRYCVNGLEPGSTYCLIAGSAASGYLTLNPPKITASPDQKLEGVNIFVVMGAKITGQVYALDTGRGIPGARIVVEAASDKSSRREIVTDNAGRYELGSLPPAEYTAYCHLPEDTGNWVLQGSEESAPHHLTLRPGEETIWDIHLWSGTTVSGRVMGTQGPLENAEVCASEDKAEFPPGKAYTDKAGEYAVTRLAAGRDYQISVCAPDHSCARRHVQIPESPVQGFDFLLGWGGTISGHLLDSRSRPVDGASVNVDPMDLYEFPAGDGEQQFGGVNAAKTSADGSFTLLNVPAGVFAFRVDRRGKIPYGVPCVSPEHVSLRQGAQLQGVEVRIRAAEDQCVEGHVLDPSKRPLAGVQVGAFIPNEGDLGSTTTDDSGHYHLDGLGDDPVCLSFTLPGFPERHLADVPIGTRTANVELAPPGTICGKVFDAETLDPIESFDVFLESDEYGLITPMMFAYPGPGEFKYGNAGAGSNTLRIGAEGYATVTLEGVIVEPGKLTERVVCLERVGIVEGVD